MGLGPLEKAGSGPPMTPLEKNSVIKVSAIVFFFLVSAKVLNFFKKILIGQLFGVSWVADAFFAASYLPYYVAIFFEGIVFLGFLPIFSQVLSQKGKEEANQFVSEVLIFVSLVTVFLVLLAWVGAPWIIREIVPGFSAGKQELTRSLFQILSLVVIFISLTSFFKALNSYFEDNAVAASSGLLDTAVTIGLTLLTWKFLGIAGAAWAAVVGALTALTFQAASLFRKHLVFSARFSIRTAWLKQLFVFLIPMGVIWAFQQIPVVILNRFGSGMWEGTISALVISHTLTTVPMGLVSHTVLFTVFPSLAKQAHQATPEEVRQTFFQTLRGGCFILVPVGFLLTGLARPLAALFFGGGGISIEGTQRIANSLACFGWATFALYADLFMTQSLIAVRKTTPAIFLSASRAVLTYVIGYVLSIHWDYQGLALSFSLALVINFFLFFPLFFRMSPFSQGWGDLFKYSLKLVLASSFAFLILAATRQWSVAEWLSSPRWFLALILIAGLGGGAAFYLIFVAWFRVEEIRSMARGLKQAWFQRQWWLGESNE